MDYTLVTQLARAIHRPWHVRERQAADLHPAVEHAIKQARPKNWHLVVLQWPHVAEDNLRLAYTRSDRKGEANLQTVTSIGKYLKAHWPTTPDHTIRDWVATYCPDEFEIRNTQLEIVSAAEFGPMSCMCSRSSYASFPFTAEMRNSLYDGTIADDDDLDYHPYSVYSPEYGWAVAVRLQDGKIVGRALVNGKTFVRSYCRAEGADKSETDYKLEAWLNKQGYTEKNRWPNGTKLRDINHPEGDGPLMPYLDGNTTTISFHRQGHWEIDSDGDHECDNTDGTATKNEKESIGECDDCGAIVYEGDDDYTQVGYHEETMVCSSCANNYTWVRGANLSRQTGYNRSAYREYYVHDDNAAQVKGTAYCVDTQSLPPDVVELERGGYAESDEVVCIEDEYYMLSDYRVVSLARDFACESYALHENTWVDGNGERYHDGEDHWTDYNGDKWLTDEETPVEVDGVLWRESELESARNAAQVAPLFSELP